MPYQDAAAGSRSRKPARNLRACRQRVAARLFHRLMEAVPDIGLGEVFAHPIAVRLGRGTVVQPDLVVVRRSRLLRDEKRCRGVPDLVVEILSLSSHRRDRSIKLARYQRQASRIT